MTKKPQSDRNGELNEETIVIPQVMQSSSAVLIPSQENPLILDMSDSTAPKKANSQVTPNSPVVIQDELGENRMSPNAMHAKLIHALVSKLGTLVEWRKVTLIDGREGYALFFDTNKWLVDPLTNELIPLGVE